MNTIKLKHNGRKPGDRQAGNALKINQAAPDPRETAQEAVHQVMPKEAGKKLVKPVPANDEAPIPMVAAKGNDEMMSQPQRTS